MVINDCPVCGEASVVTTTNLEGGLTYFIHCLNCDLCTPRYSSQEEVIEEWNGLEVNKTVQAMIEDRILAKFCEWLDKKIDYVVYLNGSDLFSDPACKGIISKFRKEETNGTNKRTNNK